MIECLIRFQIVAAIFCMTGIANAGQENEMPVPLVEAGIAYKNKGSDQFLSTLIQGSRLQFTDSTSLSQANTMLRAIEAHYGHFLGIEMIGAIPVSASTRVVYFIINYERGPLYGVADLYKTKRGEIVTNSNVNTELGQIVPPDILVKLH